MSLKSITHGEGYLMLDNRATPVPDEMMQTVGLPMGSGRGVFEAPTIRCEHCGTCFVKNPDRLRPRGHCRSCDRYICDPCELAMGQPGYIHRTFEDLATLLQSGRYRLSGTCSAPKLIPISGVNDYGS